METLDRRNIYFLKIDLIKGYEWGTDCSPEGLQQGLTHCFFLTFHSDADLSVPALPSHLHELASEFRPINPISASPESTAVIVLSAPNGARCLVQDALNKINTFNRIVFV